MVQLLQAGGQLASGFAKDSEAQSEAQQLEINARQTIAASQREAYGDRMKGKFVQSRQQALAAASGATATDPTIANLEGETGRETEYSALSKLFTGKSEGQQMQLQADMSRYQGRQALVSSGIDAIGTLAGSGGGSSMLDKYGGSMPSWMGGGSGGSGLAAAGDAAGAL